MTPCVKGDGYHFVLHTVSVHPYVQSTRSSSTVVCIINFGFFLSDLECSQCVECIVFISREVQDQLPGDYHHFILLLISKYL